MVRRPDFRLTVWLVAYASLAVSSIVLGDFSTLLRSARNDGERDLRFEGYGDNREGDVRRSDSRHQEGGVLCTTKTRMVIRVSLYCGPLRIRRQRWTAGRGLPAATLNLSSGNAGSCCMWM